MALEPFATFAFQTVPRNDVKTLFGDGFGVDLSRGVEEVEEGRAARAFRIDPSSNPLRRWSRLVPARTFTYHETLLKQFWRWIRWGPWPQRQECRGGTGRARTRTSAPALPPPPTSAHEQVIVFLSLGLRHLPHLLFNRLSSSKQVIV